MEWPSSRRSRGRVEVSVTGAASGTCRLYPLAPTVPPAGRSGRMTVMTDDELLAAFIAGDEAGMGALNQKMGVKILEASAERVVATMPVEGNTQPYGLLPRGASGGLAERPRSPGSAIPAPPPPGSPGLDLNA